MGLALFQPVLLHFKSAQTFPLRLRVQDGVRRRDPALIDKVAPFTRERAP